MAEIVTETVQIFALGLDEGSSLTHPSFGPKAIMIASWRRESTPAEWPFLWMGMFGSVSKSVEIDEMIAAIRTVASGRHYYSKGLEEKLSERRNREELSRRELEVLEKIVGSG